ncbi:MAG TPA: hypothetical protein DCM86_11630 [Verrucomicrobiales bacterium]|nr:hypothetical protein [Verrucomicrobiales bacterium]
MLLEVILALVLFVGAVTVIGIAMSTSMEGVERQRMNVHAANLALSVLSEVQLGIRVPSGAGAEAFHQPFENWTAEVALSSLEDDPSGGGGLTRAEVVVRHRQAPIVYRVCQVFALDRSRPATRKEGPEK